MVKVRSTDVVDDDDVEVFGCETTDLIANVPEELRMLPQWVAWRNQEGVKTPRTIDDRRNASTADPATWSTFEDAAAAVRGAGPGVFSGLGFVFTDADPYVGVDFDGCLIDGEFAEWAKPWLERFKGCYAEVSPSGRGVKVWARGKLPGSSGNRPVGDDRHVGIEVYDRGRYFAVTGDVLYRPDDEIPDRQDVIDDLYAWIKDRPKPAPAKPSSGLRISAVDVSTPEGRAIAYLERVDPAVSGQSGHGTTFRATCAIGPGFDLDPETAYRILWDHYNPRCDPPWSERELRHKVEQAYAKESRRGWLLDDQGERVGTKGRAGVGLADVPIEVEPGDDAQLAGLPRTDLGNAERLIARFGRDLRHCPPWGRWLVWDGRRFALDETGAVVRLAEKTVRGMLHEAAAIDDADERKAHAFWQRTSEGRARLESMIKLASTLEGVPVVHDELDRDGWFLNCRNGTVDLRTGELRSHDRADLITQLCPVDFDPDAKCPLWESTLDLFFAKDDRLIAYWQRLCGYFLTGVIREHVLPICYGTGANGKSTILGTLIALMGRDYALQAPPSMLVSQRHEAHPTALADLFRKRLVVAIETEEGQAFNESLIKMLTGGDDIRARRLYQDHWTFAPTHTVVMATNHRPVIKGRDQGIWRRAKLIPFSVSLPPERWDTTVKERLADEYPGILAWAVRGCLAWQETKGLNEPEVITRATEAYQQEQDVIGSFLASTTTTGPSYRVKAGKLYEAYRSWAERSGELVLSLRKFGESITERGFDKTVSHGVWYLGIGLPEGEY